MKTGKRSALRDPEAGEGGANAGWAVLLVDVINPMDFPGGEELARAGFPAARRIASLKGKAAGKDVPVVYVNDNFGLWQSDFRKQVEICTRPDAPGAAIARMLQPGESDYFVLKPKHSGFYSTTLELLLRHLGVSRLVLAGFAANICVLYTANDAYMRDYQITVPSDCVASETAHDTQYALDHMKKFLKADVRPESEITFD